MSGAEKRVPICPWCRTRHHWKHPRIVLYPTYNTASFHVRTGTSTPAHNPAVIP